MKNSTSENVFSILFLFLCSAVFAGINFAQSPPLFLDADFAAGVTGGTDNVKVISLQLDGKILVSGDCRFAANELHRRGVAAKIRMIFFG